LGFGWQANLKVDIYLLFLFLTKIYDYGTFKTGEAETKPWEAKIESKE